MNKSDLIAHIKQTTALSSEASTKALDATLTIIQGALGKGEDIALTGFGSFSVTARNARKGRNPKTGEPINIEASKQVRFKAGKTLKESVA